MLIDTVKWEPLNSYEQVNLDCLNNHFICLEKDLFYPYESTDLALRERCAGLFDNLTDFVSDSRSTYESNFDTYVQTTYQGLIDQVETDIADFLSTLDIELTQTELDDQIANETTIFDDLSTLLSDLSTGMLYFNYFDSFYLLL